MAKTLGPLAGGSYDQWATLWDIPQDTTDDWGQPSQEAVNLGSFYVSMRPLAGAELARERQTWPTITHIIRLPFTWDAIDPVAAHNPNARIMPNMKWSVKKDRDNVPRFFDILSAIDVEEKGVEWECRCAEKPGASL